MTDRPNPPLVSIVLCTYNGATYLEEQLASLLAQTYHPIEIIAVDDGSQDDTVHILRDLSDRLATAHPVENSTIAGPTARAENAAAGPPPRMNIFINGTNLGFVKNFEKGCRLSTGEFIALCDQDDYWRPDKIQKMMDAIGDHPMIYCDSELCDQDLRYSGKNISDIVPYQSFDNCLQLCIFSRMYGNSTLIRRSLFEKASPFLKEVPHDGWLAYHATLYGGVKYLPTALLSYRQHANNVFGVVGGKKKKKATESRSEKKKREEARIRVRIHAYYAACPDSLTRQKATLRAIMESYRSFSLPNNIRRVLLFWTNCRLLLTVKKYPVWRKYLFCLKMFFMIK
jgi:glycosyltransferase involved in cell wall biosynthesis